MSPAATASRSGHSHVWQVQEVRKAGEVPIFHIEESRSPKEEGDIQRSAGKAGWSPESTMGVIPGRSGLGQSSISFNGIAKELGPGEAWVISLLDKKATESLTSQHPSRNAIPLVALATPESTTTPREHPQEPSRRNMMEGNTSVSSMADEMNALHDFTKQAFREYPVMGQLRLNIHKKETESFATHRAKHLPRRSDLRAHLPLKNEADSLVQLYFAGLDGIYDVLDRASFQEAYQAIWVSAQTVDDFSLVVVLLVIAMVMCLRSTSIAPTVDGDRRFRDRATTIVTACQLHIDQHPSKRYSIEELQAQFLLLWAQQLNARRYKHTYGNAGKLIRTLTCAGLHRDTTTMRGRELSDDEKILRRKIWMAALEFELQAAFEHGIPPASLPTQYDRGMHEAFEYSNMKNGQHSNRLSRCSSSLGFLFKSFGLRHRLCLLLNNSNVPISPPDAKAMLDALQGHLDKAKADLSGSGTISYTFAVLKIREFLLALHRHQLLQATSSFERSAHQAAIVDHACSVIEAGHSLCSHSGPPMECLSGHQIHAALSLASVWLTDDVGHDHFLGSFLRTQALGLLDKAIEPIQLRVTHFTGDQRQLWTALAPQALVKTHYGDMGRDEALREAVTRYVAAFHGMGLLHRPAIEHGKDSQEPSSAVPGVESWALDNWFDMDLVDFNTGFDSS